MKPEHIDLIKRNEKSTTLRSLKEIYPLGINELPDREKINIRERELVYVSELIVHSIDTGRDYELGKLAKDEGYESWEEVIKILKRMRHKFPKNMWLYKFEYFKEKYK